HLHRHPVLLRRQAPQVLPALSLDLNPSPCQQTDVSCCIITGGASIDPSTSQLPKPQRNIAIDAYRGFVMLLMIAEVLLFSVVSRAYPQSLFWCVLAFNQTHVEWTWFSLHDLIQPSFAFLVGVALPYSIRSRQRRGESFARSLAHTIVRSLI